MSVPVREPPVVFAVVAKETVPAPVPDDPAVMEIQLAPDVAVHGQPVPSVSDTVAVPPAGALATDVGDTEGVQATALTNSATPFCPAPPMAVPTSALADALPPAAPPPP